MEWVILVLSIPWVFGIVSLLIWFVTGKNPITDFIEVSKPMGDLSFLTIADLFSLHAAHTKYLQTEKDDILNELKKSMPREFLLENYREAAKKHQKILKVVTKELKRRGAETP